MEGQNNCRRHQWHGRLSANFSHIAVSRKSAEYWHGTLLAEFIILRNRQISAAEGVVVDREIANGKPSDIWALKRIDRPKITIIQLTPMHFS